MRRLILDTQCLLSAVAAYAQGRETTLARVWYEFRTRETQLVFGEELLLEVGRVLDYPSVARLGISSGTAFAAAANLLLLGEYHAPVPRNAWPSLSDPNDWHLLDLLYSAQADALVTRDARVLAAGKALKMPVKTPEALGGDPSS
ncbi:PIN domain-containing protein [Deinococcus planocerae]|uniref:PIN domain-containing protein n=1 Tax=Deinococcus planocerae TaxID=1737569 RepID=UPI000C7F4212|nr:PIN domain-containing protein [Deinococcus planocerae]